MAVSVYEEKWENADFTLDSLKSGEYEACVFRNCNFSKVSLNDFFFLACEFIECDLSNAQLLGSRFRETDFNRCKMLGLHFEECDELTLEANFTSCQMESSSFHQRQRNRVSFQNCNLRHVDFSGAKLNGTSFDGCDLKDAIFEGTNLEGADFRDAEHFRIDPDNNYIKKAIFSTNGLKGLVWKWGVVVK